MCLSAVFEVSPNGVQKQVGNKVSNIHIEGGTITFVDILGDETTLHGQVEDIDLLENKIFVRVGQ